MEILIVEPGHDGHRLEYVAYAIGVCRALGATATVSTSAMARNSVEWASRATLAEVDLGPDLHQSANLFARLSDALQLLRLRKQLVFLNVGEWLLPLALVSLFGRRSLANVKGLDMRPPAAAPTDARGVVRRLVSAFVLRRGANLVRLSSPFDREITQMAANARVVLDPSGLADAGEKRTPFLESFHSWIRNGEDRPIVCVTGALSARKNVQELLDALRGTVEFRLALVGACEEPLAADIRAYRDSCVMPKASLFVHLEFVEEHELDSVLRESHISALLYDNAVGSSGILARCARVGCAVLGYQNKIVNTSIGDIVDGAVVTDLTPVGLRDAIRSIDISAAGRGFSVNIDAVKHSWTRWLDD